MYLFLYGSAAAIILSIFYFRRLRNWFLYFYGTPSQKLHSPSPTEQYINKYRTRFQCLFSEGVVNPANNQNIEPIHYTQKEYQDALKDPGNPYEKIWRTRILLESTPRGNLLMYYDAYKRVFAYYSDHYIPYSILNAVAMKYVTVYRCFDFFMDEKELPDTLVSPFTKMIQDEEREEWEKKRKAAEKQGIKSGPFAKLKASVGKASDMMTKPLPKPVQQPLLKSVNLVKSKSREESEKPYQKNGFLHLGKVANYSVLQKYVKRTTVAAVAAVAAEVAGLVSTTGAAEVAVPLSYSEYKKRKALHL